jgi:Protein of unknown function (DUF1559)
MRARTPSKTWPFYSLLAVASSALGGLGMGCSASDTVLAEPALVVVMFASSLISVLLGVRARKQVRRSSGRVRGSGLATWGIVMAIGLVVVSLLPRSTHCTGMRPAQALNNLKAIGLALENYHQDHGRFPPSVVYNPEGRPLYSWRVLILPYLEQKDLYDNFDLNEAWDSPRNRQLLARRPAVYDPVGVAAEPTLTYSQVFVGKGTAFEGREGTTLTDFPDGPERTILVVEAADPVPWTKPIDLSYTAGTQLPSLGGVFKDRSGPFGFGGVDGCNVVFADTRARFIPRGKLAEPGFRALITRNGRESTDDSEFW